jgi:hypothetical protein
MCHLDADRRERGVGAHALGVEGGAGIPRRATVVRAEQHCAAVCEEEQHSVRGRHVHGSVEVNIAHVQRLHRLPREAGVRRAPQVQ